MDLVSTDEIELQIEQSEPSLDFGASNDQSLEVLDESNVDSSENTNHQDPPVSRAQARITSLNAAKKTAEEKQREAEERLRLLENELNDLKRKDQEREAKTRKEQIELLQYEHAEAVALGKIEDIKRLHAKLMDLAIEEKQYSPVLKENIQKIAEDEFYSENPWYRSHPDMQTYAIGVNAQLLSDPYWKQQLELNPRGFYSEVARRTKEKYKAPTQPIAESPSNIVRKKDPLKIPQKLYESYYRMAPSSFSEEQKKNYVARRYMMDKKS